MKYNPIKRIKHFFASRQNPFNAKLLVVICFLTFISGFFSFIVSLLFGSVITIVSALLIFVFSAFVFLYYFKTRNHSAALLIYFVIYNFILLPLNFFTGGGNFSGMPYYFITAIVISVILVPDKHRVIFSVVLILFDSALILLNAFFPHIVVSLPNRTSIVYDSFTAFLLSSVFMCVVLHMLTNEHHIERSKVESFNKYLQDQSIHDPLTNLYNRRYLLNVLDKEIINAKESGKPLSVIMFDIDFFKNVNDTYGHLIGDEVLRNFSQLLLMETIDVAVAGRYGGEEFLIVLAEKNAKSAYDFADHLRLICASNSLMASNKEIVTVSGGIGEYRDGMNVVQLVEAADNNLYKAKNTGRNKIVM